jgi:uroporphyrinogen-III synthase
MKRKIYLLSNKSYKDTISLPMLDIEFIQADINFENYDAILFTSKNALFSINSFSSSWKQKDILCIAQMTANEVEKLDVDVSFTGSSGHGDDFAYEIIDNLKNKYKNKKLLYLRGDKVVSNLVDILNKNDIKCDQIIVYKTVCKNYNIKPDISKNSIIIFTSPSTIECFFKNFSWDSSYKAISIGKTTAKYFPNYITPIIADNTSIQSCINKAKIYLGKLQ